MTTTKQLERGVLLDAASEAMREASGDPPRRPRRATGRPGTPAWSYEDGGAWWRWSTDIARERPAYEILDIIRSTGT